MSSQKTLGLGKHTKALGELNYLRKFEESHLDICRWPEKARGGEGWQLEEDRDKREEDVGMHNGRSVTRPSMS